MGLFDMLFSSSSSQTTTVPAATEQEKKFMRMFEQAVMPQLLEESGFEMKETTGLGLNDEEYGRYLDLKKRERVVDSGGKNTLSAKQGALSEAERVELGNLRSVFNEHGAAGEVTYELVETKEGAARREKRAEQETRAEEITNKFQENTMKFLNGDFSITAAQQKSIQEVMAPAREAVSKMYNNMDKVVSEGKNRLTAMTEQFKKYEEQRDHVENELFKMGIKESGDQISAQVMNRAIASGRDPADPEFTSQISTMVADEARRGGLQLEGIQIERRAQHERELLDASERLRGEELGVAQARGGANLGIEDQARSLRMAPLTGSGGQALQSTQLIDAINQQRMANQQFGMGNVQAGGGQYGAQAASLRGERMAQPTTVGTSTPSPFSVALGAGTAAASIYGGVAAGGLYGLQAQRLRQLNQGGA